jgi:hypothetical protein
VFLWKSSGNILSFKRSALWFEQPYMKRFLDRE